MSDWDCEKMGHLREVTPNRDDIVCECGQPWTPTYGEILDRFMDWDGQTLPEYEAPFDRWLAQHDKEIANYTRKIIIESLKPIHTEQNRQWCTKHQWQCKQDRDDCEIKKSTYCDGCEDHPKYPCPTMKTVLGETNE